MHKIKVKAGNTHAWWQNCHEWKNFKHRMDASLLNTCAYFISGTTLMKLLAKHLAQ